MADGSGKPALEADQAAAEAAREARAEVLDRIEADKASAPAAGRKTSPKAASTSEWHEFSVEVWITDFNGIEFGFWRKERNKAKSRQFTSDMDIMAEVIENGERTGLLGYREDLWKKNSGMDRRLVFKLFGEKLNWKATMDLMVGRSLQLTLGAHGFPVVAYSINAGDHDHMVYLERSAHKWPLMPENFSFFVFRDGKPQFFRLRRDLVGIGGDYTLYNERDEEVGSVDGAILTLGGRWLGRLHKDYADPQMLNILKLFCCAIIFNRQARRHLRSLSRLIHQGELKPKIERQEAELYLNPRRMR